MQFAALKAKRETPRRNDGRVQHARMKPKQVKPNAEQERFWDSLPNECQACGGLGQVIHHIMADVPGKVSRRDHFFVVKLCAGCHNMRTDSVHLLGSEAKFEEVHGVDLINKSLLNLGWWSA